jgi:release factor glutamine methyltransferase
MRSRWLDSVPGGVVFDAIVSNPPYVAREDETRLAAEVRDFEPGLALYAEPHDDLSSYRAILGGIGGRLRPSGLLAFEVGLGQAERVAALVDAAGLGPVEVLPDLANIPRVVLGRRAA